MLSLCMLAAVSQGCSGDAPPGPPQPAALVGVDTVAPMKVKAGDALTVSCVIVDEKKETHAPTAEQVPVITYSPAASVQIDDKGKVTAVRAGEVQATCAFPSLSLVDDTPATFTIAPGAPAIIDTALDTEQVTAGGKVNATCTTWDEFGNVISDAKPTLTISPVESSTMVSGLSATLSRAGAYEIACALDGAKPRGSSVEVVPGLPATLMIARVPDLQLYAVGAVVEVTSIVTDEFGNLVMQAPVGITSAPAATASFGLGRFRYGLEGTYTVRVKVPQPTQTGADLVASTTIKVGGVGPTITCDGPANGEMINLAPGAKVTFGGHVTDPNGVASVTVNGAPASLAGDAYQASVTTRFGINTAEVIARDMNGAENRRVCWFLSADKWAGETALLGDSVSLSLTQGAVDDGSRAGAINSLADILAAALNSSGLKSALDSALSAANPLKAKSCDSQSCTFLGCVCWYSSGVQYRSLSLPGPNTVSMTLVDGGLTAVAYIPNVAVNLRVYGDVGPVPYDTTGWVTLSYVQVKLTLDAALSNKKPHVSIRSGSVSTSVGTVSTAFAGVDGWIINNVVVPLAEGMLRDAIKSQLTSYIQDNFNQVIDGVVSNLNISAFGQTESVPKLDGKGSIPLSFAVDFSSLSPTSQRLLFGLGTRISAPSAQARPSRGVAVLPGPGSVLGDPTISAPSTVAGAVHYALLNQALHALWRGGLFDVTLSGASLGGGVGAGASVKVRALLPPVTSPSPNMTSPTGVELALGALQIELTYPGLFGGTDEKGNPLPPLRVDLGARATTTVTIKNDTLQFGGLNIIELKFATDIPLGSATSTAVESLLRTVIGKFVDTSLNKSLPAVPIPSFPLPSSLSSFGLPTGAELGLVSPSLATEPRHLVVRGKFGLK